MKELFALRKRVGDDNFLPSLLLKKGDGDDKDRVAVDVCGGSHDGRGRRV